MGKEIIITWPDQSNAILSNFILTGLHAACCMHTCQYWLPQNWNDFDKCSWCTHCTHHQNVLQSPLDRSACIFSSWSPECVPPVKIVCSGCNPKVQVICGLPDPYPVLLLFCKGGSTFFNVLNIFFHKTFSHFELQIWKKNLRKSDLTFYWVYR